MTSWASSRVACGVWLWKAGSSGHHGFLQKGRACRLKCQSACEALSVCIKQWKSTLTGQRISGKGVGTCCKEKKTKPPEQAPAINTPPSPPFVLHNFRITRVTFVVRDRIVESILNFWDKKWYPQSVLDLCPELSSFFFAWIFWKSATWVIVQYQFSLRAFYKFVECVSCWFFCFASV